MDKSTRPSLNSQLYSNQMCLSSVKAFEVAHVVIKPWQYDDNIGRSFAKV